MQKYSKAKAALNFNLVIAIFLIIGSIICFTNLNKTIYHLGFDLYLIFALAFLVFAIPFIINIIKYFLLPETVLTTDHNILIIHKLKKEIKIDASTLLSISKQNNFGEYFGFDVGSIKLIFTNRNPITIRFIEGLKDAHEALEVFVFGNVNRFRK